MFKPEFHKTLKNYNSKLFFKDLIAGFIVVVVSLPLAIAFAIASGVSPERGIYTAIFGGFLVSLLGGSRVQIAGPSGTFAVVIIGLVSLYGYEGLVYITILAGIFLILIGIFKLGGLVRFMPYTIITGFTTGAAVLIFISQVGNFLGLSCSKLPPDFIGKIVAYFNAIQSCNFIALTVSVFSLLLLIIWPKINKKIPGALVAIILSTLLVYFLKLPVATIGSIPSVFPVPSLPPLAFNQFQLFIPEALTLALLISIESLLSAVVADGMTGFKHNSNTELIAHGIANIVTPIFGGIPVTAAVARTATNIKSGGKTPVAGIINAIVLLLILLLLGNLAKFIPMPTLSAILVLVAYNMSGIPSIKSILKGQKSDSIVMIVTFLITVFISMTLAIEVGLILAGFLFVRKMIQISSVNVLKHEINDADANTDTIDSNSMNARVIPPNVIVFEVEGPLFFGSIQKFEETIASTSYEYKVMILRLRDTIYIDAGGINIISQLFEDCKKRKITLLISDIHTQPFMIATQTGLDKKIGLENIFGNLDAALEKAATLVVTNFTK